MQKPDDCLYLFFGEADEAEVAESVSVQPELEKHFKESSVPATQHVHRWRSINKNRLPFLSKLARDILCVPATSV